MIDMDGWFGMELDGWFGMDDGDGKMVSGLIVWDRDGWI